MTDTTRLYEELRSRSESIWAADQHAIEQYNAKKDSGSGFYLRSDLGPCAFEGDILRAPVVLLLSNPCANDLTVGDHQPSAETLRDFPLWGLSPLANPLLNMWWSRRLSGLIREFGVNKVARAVAAIQLTPWASKTFDAANRLPSRGLMLGWISHIMERDALLIVMRSKGLWFASTEIERYKKKVINPNPRCSYVSEGNLGGLAWAKIVDSIQGYVD